MGAPGLLSTLRVSHLSCFRLQTRFPWVRRELPSNLCAAFLGFHCFISTGKPLDRQLRLGPWPA